MTDKELIEAFNRLQRKLDETISKNIELSGQIEMLQKENYQLSLQVVEKLKKTLEEVREITKKYYLSDKKLLATGIMINPLNAIIKIQEIINEVLPCET